MTLTPAQIVHRIEDDPKNVERIATRALTNELVIVEPDPAWPHQFQEIRDRIKAALGDTALTISHVGSTSVLGLPAKAIVDIDLTVKDIRDEDSYVSQLQSTGFTFLLRERAWHEHRFFGLDRGPMPANLHVFGPDCPEVERHRILKEWLIAHPEDRERYAEIKIVSVKQSREAGETVTEYNKRKEKGLRDILDNAFRALGLIK